MTGKNIGMIVTFRKPFTMAKNVEDAIRLFSNEARDWESLIPKKYEKVRKDLVDAYKAYTNAKAELKKDPADIKKKIEAVKTFQAVKRFVEAIESYEEFETDFEELKSVIEIVADDFGHIENIKAEVREELNPDDINDYPDVFEVEFSADQRATLEETIDSYYISQLLRDIRNEESKRKFDEIIKDKPDIVKSIYNDVLDDLFLAEPVVQYDVNNYFQEKIESIIAEAATALCVPRGDLQTSLNEYNPNKGDVPYLNTLIEHSEHTKETFERNFPGEKFRRKIVVIGDYWKRIMDERLLPLKKEMASHEGRN